MQFKSWRDYYIFLRDYVKFSCLNCKYTGKLLDTDEEHTDGEYARHFCTYNIAIVRFDFQTLCSNWINEDTYEELPEIDERNFLFDEKYDAVFEERPYKRWSIEEIREVLNEEDTE